MNGTTASHQRLILLTFQFGILATCSVLPGRSTQAQSATHAKAPIRMPQGAFLRTPSADVARLVQQVKSDHTVAVRYARLFHLPVKLVPLAFAQLRLKPLTNDHVLEVHYVQEGEKLVFKPRRVTKGTPVYCLPDGTPLLVRVCGNPIRTRVSPEMYSAVPIPDFNAAEVMTPRPVANSIAMAGPPMRAVLPPPTPLLPIPVVEAVGVLAPTALPIVAPSLSPPALKAASLPPVYHWVHGGPGLVGLAPLALLPLLSFGGGHGSAVPILPVFPGGSVIAPGESGGIIPLSPPVPIPPTGIPIIVTPQDTPEPGAIALVVTSLLSAGLLYTRKRRQ